MIRETEKRDVIDHVHQDTGGLLQEGSMEVNVRSAVPLACLWVTCHIISVRENLGNTLRGAGGYAISLWVSIEGLGRARDMPLWTSKTAEMQKMLLKDFKDTVWMGGD